MAAPSLARALLAALLLAALGCDDYTCPPDDTFVVDENGTCAPAPTQFTLAAQACHIYVQDSAGSSGLPARGAMGQHPRAVRQGGFILYGGEAASFRLCRAERVEYRLELACVDAAGAPTCNATLTEPAQ
jgi:hypothetical protein